MDIEGTVKLRKLLDERDIEHEDDLITTRWGEELFSAGGLRLTRYAAQEASGKVNLTMYAISPEQAIAATLGSGTCHNQWQWNSGFCCPECFYTILFVDKLADKPFKYCPNCRKEVRP